MAKPKKKHLDALDAKPQQDTQQAHMIGDNVNSERLMDATLPSSSKQANSVAADSLTLSSLTSPCHQQQSEQLTQHDTEGAPNVDLSPSCERGHAFDPDPLSLSQQHASWDDEASDSSSWIEVRKQRVVIIIPSLPKPEQMPLNSHARSGAGYGGRRDRALLYQYKAKDKVSKKNGHPKEAINSLNRNSNGKKAWCRKSSSAAAQPISGMDILLASALGAVHASQGESHPKGTRADTSLAIADRGVEPKGSPLKGSVKRKKACKPKGQFKRELCLMEVSGPAHDRSIPNIVDREGKVLIYCGRRLPAPSFDEAFRALTLKKQLDKMGGFRKWLCSLGLAHFKDVFEKRIWTEAELLQLSMDDLKRMGKLAVGPRRKFIWAVNHLSQQLM